MALELAQVGMPQAGHKFEGVTGYFWDTVLYKGSTGAGTKQTVNRAGLFLSPKKRPELQNNAFPMSAYNQFTIEYIGIEHNLQFDNKNDLEIFEKSYIKISKLGSDVVEIPISTLLNYNRLSSQDQTDTDRITNSTFLQRAAGGTFRKIDPIVIPENVDITMEFVPAGNNLKTVSINENTGFKWGAGIYDDSDSPTQFIRINIVGTLLRQKAV